MFGDRGAKVAQYLLKGQQVGVSGSVNMREWTNKDSETKTSLEVRVSELDLIGGKGDGEQRQAPQAERPQAQAQSAPAKKDPYFDDMDDSIPF